MPRTSYSVAAEARVGGHRFYDVQAHQGAQTPSHTTAPPSSEYSTLTRPAPSISLRTVSSRASPLRQPEVRVPAPARRPEQRPRPSTRRSSGIYISRPSPHARHLLLPALALRRMLSSASMSRSSSALPTPARRPRLPGNQALVRPARVTSAPEPVEAKLRRFVQYICGALALYDSPVEPVRRLRCGLARNGARPRNSGPSPSGRASVSRAATRRAAPPPSPPAAGRPQHRLGRPSGRAPPIAQEYRRAARARIQFVTRVPRLVPPFALRPHPYASVTEMMDMNSISRGPHHAQDHAENPAQLRKQGRQTRFVPEGGGQAEPPL